MSGTVYTVASGKGGVGKTTTSVNLAVALWQEGNAVGLVDADIGMANLAAVLNLEPEATLHDVLSGRATVEEAVVEAQGGNLLVLPGDRSLESFANADPRELRAAVDDLAERCDYVIVDTGAGLSYEDVLPLGMAHGVLLVTTPDPAAFGDTRKTMEVADLLGAPIRGLVVTRAVEDTDAAAIAGEIGAELLGTIPEDPAVMGSTVAGNPLESHAPDSAAAGAYRDLAATLLSGDDEWLEAHPREPVATVDEVASAVAADSDDSGDYSHATGDAGAVATEDVVDSEEAGDIGDLLAGSGEGDEPDGERGRESPGEASATVEAAAEDSLGGEEADSGDVEESAEPETASADVGEPTDSEADRTDEAGDETGTSYGSGALDAEDAPDVEEAGDLDEGDEPDEAAELDEPEEAEAGEAGRDEGGEESEGDADAAEAEVAEDEVAGDEVEGDEALEASEESEDEEGDEPASAEPGDGEEPDETEDEAASEESAEPEEEEPAEPEKRGGLLGWLGRLF